jgi:predicted nuclease with TOPRIM domain
VTYSRFYLCDLQVHTPADHQQRYGDVGGRDPNASFAEKLMRAHASAGVSVIAVTDHNRVDWYPVLRAAGEPLGVTVFPGLEFSVNGCHLIAIWDCTDKGYRLAQQFLSKLFPPGVEPLTDTGPRVVTRGQVLEIAEEVVEHHGLVVAPHATMKSNGVFAKGVCSNSADVAQSEFVAAFDVCGSKSADVLKNPRAQFRNSAPRWFISGDTRALDDVGKRAVYLKLGATPTLEGLRQAFLAPATRVRFPSALHKDWGHVQDIQFFDGPLPTWSRLTRLHVQGGLHDGFDTEFGPGLNAIIGGKGTGKSALIEILRYVAEANGPTIPELERNRARNFGANADAALQFADDDGESYEVRRSGGSESAKLLRGGRATSVPVARRLSMTVFGQRELQGLAERPGDLRAYVASNLGDPWRQADEENSALLDELQRLDGQLTTVERKLAQLADKASEQADLNERLDRAKAAGVEDLLKESQDLERAKRAMAAALGWPEKVTEQTLDLRKVLPPPAVPGRASGHEAVTKTLSVLAKAIETAAGDVDSAVGTANGVLAAHKITWQAEYDSQRRDIERGLADAGLQAPKQYSELQERLAELDEDLGDYPTLKARAVELASSRLEELRKLGEVRRRKSRLIETAARDLTDRVGPKVRLVVDALGDREQFREALEAALRGQSVRADQLARLAAEPPAKVAEAARTGPAAIEALGASGTTASKLAAVAPASLRKLEEVDTPDRISVQIDLAASGSPDWRPIGELSPGQRATALLALALASGQEPLLIDQPEDDLDNRFIFEQVVKLLARVCEGRQVIVATHNANIPILGDAEMVIAFDATADRASVLASGGLEDPKVAAVAREILEGGDEAFKARQRRYLAAR